MDSDILCFLREQIKLSNYSKRRFIQDILTSYVAEIENTSTKNITTYVGYKKSAYYVLDVTDVLKNKLDKLANRYDISISELIRCAFINWYVDING